MMNLPTLKQLRYFVALEEKEHFGKAAESCFVSQSAFSVAIKELETQLGSQLVDRTNKNVTITRVGREVANHARHCLRDIEYLAEIARSNQESLIGGKLEHCHPTGGTFNLPLVSKWRLIPNLIDS